MAGVPEIQTERIFHECKFVFLDLLRQLPSNSVDLTVTSPPYCMGKEYERTDHLRHFVKAHLRILKEIIRVTKTGGSICWQVG